LEGLTATFIADGSLFHNDSIFEGPRGHPKNVGKTFTAVHPVVRTNPVTGWKSLYAGGPLPKYINEVTPKESQELLRLFREAITENHDLQCRFKWRNVNDFGKSSGHLLHIRITDANNEQLSGITVARSTLPPTTMTIWGKEPVIGL
jgi:alpha-ketoglutarate-dependent taurine dioxygenase